MAAASSHPGGKVLGLFFFKGGVGKTTHTVNIAGALAQKGHRVLIVDYDPQCNVSQYFNTPAPDADTAVDDQTVRTAEARAVAASMSSQLAGGAGALPIIEQDDASDFKDPHSIDAFVSGQNLGDYKNVSAPFYKFFALRQDWEDLVTEDDGAGVGIRRTNEDFFSGDATGELYLLPGTPALTKYEQHLVDAVKNAHDNDNECKPYGLCHRLLDLLRDRFDYIVVDMSPNAGALNQVMSMACDYLISPCHASVYSAGSMRALFETVYPSWFKRRKRIAEFQDEDCTDPNLKPYCIRPDPPTLFPVLVGNYHVVGQGQEWARAATQKLARSSANFVMTIKDWLIRFSMTAERDKQALVNAFALNPADMIICFMMNSEMTVAACEEAGRSVLEMTPELYLQEYNVEVDFKSKKKRKRASATASSTAEEKMTEGHFKLFKWELEYCKRRYGALADWIIAFAGGARICK